MTTTPPGWYDDGHGALRWWDGTQWTEHVAQPDAESSPAPTEAEIVAAQLGFEQPETAPSAGSAAPVQPGEAPASTAQPEAASPYAAGAAQPGAAAPPAYPAGQAYPPADQGYPQGAYPGTTTGGAFSAATEPRSKSKLWIVWVVLGLVLLGIVIAAAVLIPLLMLSASTANSGGQTDDERAAVATVELYDDAWQDGDCDSFTAATTEDFRAASGFTDCATFETDADRFDENFDDYEVKVTDVETQGDEIGRASCRERVYSNV